MAKLNSRAPRRNRSVTFSCARWLIRAVRAPKNMPGSPRFGVVVQANELLPRSVVLVAPTSQSARPASFRPEIEIEGESTLVLVEQVGAVDVTRLGNLVGHVTPEQMWGIDEALLTVFGLS